MSDPFDDWDEDRTYSAMFVGATGGLFLRFARLETILSFELRAHLESFMGGPKSGLKGFMVASAIYGGMRLKNSSQMIKRLALQQEYPKNECDYLDSFFAHLGHIADLRDKLAHQLVIPASGERAGTVHIVDAFNTHTPSNYKRYELSVDAVLNAAIDLSLAAKRVSVGLLLRKGSRKRFDLTPPAWRYKPSSLKLVRQRSETSPPKPRLPPQSSRR